MFSHREAGEFQQNCRKGLKQHMAQSRTRYKVKRLNLYASDGDISIHGDIHVGAQVGPGGLTTDEHKRVIRAVHRALPKILEGVPFADFGIDNISISKRRA